MVEKQSHSKFIKIENKLVSLQQGVRSTSKSASACVFKKLVWTNNDPSAFVLLFLYFTVQWHTVYPSRGICLCFILNVLSIYKLVMLSCYLGMFWIYRSDVLKTYFSRGSESIRPIACLYSLHYVLRSLPFNWSVVSFLGSLAVY